MTDMDREESIFEIKPSLEVMLVIGNLGVNFVF